MYLIATNPSAVMKPDRKWMNENASTFFSVKMSPTNAVKNDKKRSIDFTANRSQVIKLLAAKFEYNSSQVLKLIAAKLKANNCQILKLTAAKF